MVDHMLQAFQFSQTGKYGYHLGELNKTSFDVFGAERIKQKHMIALSSITVVYCHC